MAYIRQKSGGALRECMVENITCHETTVWVPSALKSPHTAGAVGTVLEVPQGSG